MCQHVAAIQLRFQPESAPGPLRSLVAVAADRECSCGTATSVQESRQSTKYRPTCFFIHPIIYQAQSQPLNINQPLSTTTIQDDPLVLARHALRHNRQCSNNSAPRSALGDSKNWSRHSSGVTSPSCCWWWLVWWWSSYLGLSIEWYNHSW